MKKLLVNLGGKVAAFAEDIVSYNDPGRVVQQTKQTGGTGSGSAEAAAGHGHGSQTLDPVLEYLLRNVRSRHVRQHFARTPASEYTEYRHVTVQAATFNVGGKKPPVGLRLDEWLGPGPTSGTQQGKWPPGSSSSVASGGPDVLAIAFQELVPLNAGNVMGVWSSGHVEAWDRCIAAYLNGEEWAAQRYGPVQSSTTAAALLDSKWLGPTGAPAPQAAADSAGGSCFVQVASKQLVGVYLSVWVRGGLLPEVRGVQVTTVATGFGGYLGNKGAVAARMRLYDSSLVFVASHLSAGESEGDELRRNADVADILRRAVFVSGGAGVDAGGTGGTPMTASQAALISASLGPGHWPTGPSSLTDHDLIVWLGDLNYRLVTAPAPNPSVGGGGGATAAASEGPAGGAAGAAAGSGSSGGGALTDADVRAAIRSGALEPLLAVDQLNREREAGRVFAGWNEGHITFPPTYKFKVGTHIYNGDDLPTPGSVANLVTASASSAASLASAVDMAGGAEELDAAAGGAGNVNDPERHKRRTPAWCDRVLWWSRRGARGGSGPRMEQLAYWRGEMTISDHKPVAAAFRAEVVSYDRRRIETALQAALRSVDLMLQSLRPRVTVAPVVLEAGGWVALGRPVKQLITLNNSGTVEALWHFVPPPAPSRKAVSGGGSEMCLDDETPALPPWLIATPAEGVLQPGESCEMELTVLVEGGPGGAASILEAAATAQSATKSQPPASCSSAPLDGIVILRIEDSGDKFISIGGRYRRSFLGLSLEQLVHLGATPALPPAEAHTLAEQLGLEPLQLVPLPGPAAVSVASSLLVPKELTALVAALLADGAKALRHPGILVHSTELVLLSGSAGDGAEKAGAAQGRVESAAAAGLRQPGGRAHQRALLRRLERLRLHLDAGSGVPPGTDPHEVAALLLLWCGQLTQPLLPATLADAAVAAPPTSPAAAAALIRRHLTHRIARGVFSQLLHVLRAALRPAVADVNGLTPEQLAAVAGNWWLPPLGAGAAAEAGRCQQALMELLLTGGNEEVEIEGKEVQA